MNKDTIKAIQERSNNKTETYDLVSLIVGTAYSLQIHNL